MLLNENYMMYDRVVLGLVITAGWAFILIGLIEEEDDTNTVDVLLFIYANATVIIGTLYLLYTWFTRWAL